MWPAVLCLRSHWELARSCYLMTNPWPWIPHLISKVKQRNKPQKAFSHGFQLNECVDCEGKLSSNVVQRQIPKQCHGFHVTGSECWCETQPTITYKYISCIAPPIVSGMLPEKLFLLKSLPKTNGDNTQRTKVSTQAKKMGAAYSELSLPGWPKKASICPFNLLLENDLPQRRGSVSLRHCSRSELECNKIRWLKKVAVLHTL